MAFISGYFQSFLSQETKNKEQWDVLYLTNGNVHIIYKRNKPEQLSKKMSQLAFLNSVSGTYLENIIVPLSVNSEWLFLILSTAGS